MRSIHRYLKIRLWRNNPSNGIQGKYYGHSASACTLPTLLRGLLNRVLGRLGCTSYCRRVAVSEAVPQGQEGLRGASYVLTSRYSVPCLLDRRAYLQTPNSETVLKDVNSNTVHLLTSMIPTDSMNNTDIFRTSHRECWISSSTSPPLQR
jgi:hypothetical protein